MTPTGPRIDASLVRRLIAEQFPRWADLPVVAVEPGGWDNRTFRLGDEWSVRLPSDSGYAPQVEKEQEWLPLLAAALPLPIPTPIAQGRPAEGYPHPWSVYRWIEGTPATVDAINDIRQFAAALGRFLLALHTVNAADGPPPGLHTAFRGGPLTHYDAEARRALAALGGSVDARTATAIWETALDAAWSGPPVWFHGDVAADNLLLRAGRLAAVIDFGCAGVGDPACDVTIAWTLLDAASSQVFRNAAQFDRATWARGRGWALWKALITLEQRTTAGPVKLRQAAHALERVITDFEANA